MDSKARDISMQTAALCADAMCMRLSTSLFGDTFCSDVAHINGSKDSTVSRRRSSCCTGKLVSDVKLLTEVLETDRNTSAAASTC